MKAIFERRSIRKYENREVSEDLIKDLLKAGMSAPSAVNERPWHFIVVRDQQVREEISRIHPYASMVQDASVVIAVCADLSLEIARGYWPQDCAAATENILLEAQDSGLGGVWLGVHPNEQRKQDLGALFTVPDNVQVFSLVSVGYPDEIKETEDRYDESRVHWGDRW